MLCLSLVLLDFLQFVLVQSVLLVEGRGLLLQKLEVGSFLRGHPHLSAYYHFLFLLCLVQLKQEILLESVDLALDRLYLFLHCKVALNRLARHDLLFGLHCDGQI